MTPSNGLDSIHASNKNILCVEDISLSFGGITALSDVSFDVLHVLMVRDRHDFLGRAEHWRLGQIA